MIEGLRTTKDLIIRVPGGLSLITETTAVEDATNDFAFPKGLRVTLNVLWPKLHLRAEGITGDGYQIDRESIHDFAENISLAISRPNGEVHRMPGRHPFSSGYSLYFKALHWAEGWQSYREGERSEDSELWMPEFMDDSTYEIMGNERIGETGCWHARTLDDELWLSHGNGWFVHRRVRKHPGTDVVKSSSEILSYQHVDGLPAPLPAVVLCSEYDSDGTTNLAPTLVTRTELVKATAGAVSPDVFELNLPENARMQDLVSR
ncbi:hypothetical protein [Rubinisphaera margarita]|uniref:hypothetical protein n=1 Tax=Rubinisphaera margarita TaxID=2909586 RepID=UPI001EE9734E|nr:hypothetical protein [Rubinisphaera margarita]MCG6154331.1 hypothetical protein [Rubinisphaera margarita]